jgi:hypothetical protein
LAFEDIKKRLKSSRKLCKEAGPGTDHFMNPFLLVKAPGKMLAAVSLVQEFIANERKESG